MLRKLQILCFLFYACISFAQNSGTYNKTKYYWGDSIYTLNTIQSFVKFDSALFIACGIVDSLHDQRLTLVNTDLEGNIINKIKLGSTNYKLATYPGNSIILDKDTDLLVCNAISYDSTYFTDGYIVKLNQDLDTIWSMVDRLPDSLAGCNPGEDPVNFFSTIVECPEGGYLVVGNYNKNCLPNNLYAYLLKIDTDGNVEWRKVYQNITAIYNIEVAPDSGYYFAIGLNSHVNLYKIDKLGNVQWNVIVNSNPQTGKPMIVALDDSNDIIIGSAFWYDLSNDIRGLTVTKVNSQTHSIVWEKDYYLFQSFRCPSLHQNMKIKCLPNGDIIVCATAWVVKYDSTAGGFKGVMLKLNGNGDSLWSHYYNYGEFSDECQFNDMVLTDDAGFIAAGYHFPHSALYNSGAWLVRMDSNGISPGCFTLNVQEISMKNYSIEVHPNPARDVVNVSIGSSFKVQVTSFEIVDILGKVVRKEKLGSKINYISFDVSGLPEGLYLISFYSNEFLIGSGKIIVQKN